MDAVDFEGRIATLEQKVLDQYLEQKQKILALTDLLTEQGKETLELRKRVKNLESPKHESHYQKLLEIRFQGKHLHIEGVGTTDVTTSDAHNEVKNWRRYHEVPGQLAKYNHGSPRPRKCVYFFGNPPSSKKIEHILNLMTLQNIEMYSFDLDDEIVAHSCSFSLFIWI